MDNQNLSPTVLFTNLFILARTGSELHILELSRSFIERGWEVTVYALVIGYPLQGELQRAGVNLVSYGEESKLADSYDLLIAQHHLVSDYLWAHTEISFKKVIVSVLGLGDMEAIPSFCEEIDGVVFVSEEAQAHNASFLEEYDPPTLVFPNSVSEEFFASFSNEPARNDHPSRIAVVSNHIPSEVLQLKEQAFPPGTIIDYFGYGRESVEITAPLLRSYDLIITIGRTIQACFAAGVPCYCYDHFGGPGYIAPAEIEEHAYANFSGRSNRRQLSAEELKEDIFTHYRNALSELPVLHSIAQRKWSFEDQFSRLYRFIEELPACHDSKRTVQGNVRNSFNTRLLCDLYREVILNETALAGISWSNQENDAERTESCAVRYHLNSWVNTNLINEIPKGATLRTFSPDTEPCTTKLSLLPPTIESTQEETTYSFFHYHAEIDLHLSKGEDLWFCTSPISDQRANDEYYSNSRSLKWLLRQVKDELKRRLTHSSPNPAIK